MRINICTYGSRFNNRRYSAYSVLPLGYRVFTGVKLGL
jgi:hypothetical protein